MIVVTPENQRHLFKIVPRYYPTDIIKIDLYNEATKITETIQPTYTVTDGIMTIDFRKDFTENQKFQVKLYDENQIIFRGKMISTSQNPQDFKQTDNLYRYE